MKIFIVCFIILFSSSCDADMFGFFKMEKFQYVLSTEINGKLVNNGNGYAGEVVYLHTSFMKNRYISKTTTSDDGKFHFNPSYHYQKFKEPELHESHSYIGLYIYINGKKHYLLETRFSNFEPFDFIINNLLDLNCELNSKEYRFFFENKIINNGRELIIASRCDLNGYMYKELLDEEI